MGPKLNTFALFFSLGFASAASAHAPEQGHVWASVGPSFYRTRASQAIATRDPSVGQGLVVEGDLDDNGGVEIAMLYTDKLYLREKNTALLAERAERMYVTTGYRHWFVPWMSTGLAFFSSYSMGDPRVVADERSPDADFTTTARDITEYGFDASWQWEFWGSDTAAAVLDARYSFSTSRKSQEAADTYGALLVFKMLVPKATRASGK